MSNGPRLSYTSSIVYLGLMAILIMIYATVILKQPSLEPVVQYTPADYHPSEEELAFPLAFSILAHGEFDRLERLVLAIYRPHNFYCIHIDAEKNSPRQWTHMLDFLAQFGPTVFLVPFDKSVRVRWGTFSVLQAELVCARKALESGYEWKYYINLTGQEFPLRTDWELVRVLKIMNGSNLVQGSKAWKREWAIPPAKSYENLSITWFEGSFHVALTRSFIQTMFHNPKAQLLLNAIQLQEQRIGSKTFPDEQYFITLNNNPAVIPMPGAFLGGPASCARQPFLTRYKIWYANRHKCQSKRFKHMLCIFGPRDVDLMKQANELFANKFSRHVDPDGYDELERWIHRKRQYEIDNLRLHPSFNQSYYEGLELRWNHL